MIKHRLYKRGNVYHADFWIDGKRFRLSTGATKKPDAEKIAQLKIKRTVEKHYTKSDFSLSDLIDRYITLIRIENKTYKDKIPRLKIFLAHVGDKTLSLITVTECQDFINELSKRNIKKSSINRYIATYKHMFNKALDWGMVRTNPFRKIKQFKETPRLRFFTENEIQRLIKAAKELSQENSTHNQYLFYYIMLTAILTGMRLGEIINLKWFDLRDGNFIIQNSKSGLKRIVPIKKELLAELKKLDSSDEYIFPLKRRQPDVVTKIWKKVADRAQVKDGRFHDLRHTFASMLIKNGVDIVTVSSLLGHSSLEMTQIYAHSSELQKAAAIDRIKL